MWTHRIILESLLYEKSSFVTLTYDDQYLRSSEPHGLPTLFPDDMKNWLKRLRKKIHPQKVRYFGVGEYGEHTYRPHYHVALFGWPPCSVEYCSPHNKCMSCKIIMETWGLGLVQVGVLSAESAAYVAGYIIKKLQDSTEELLGRHPEFARMSTVPGIGHDALWDVADTLMRHDIGGDVPTALRHGKRVLPLGRYLTRKLRLMCGKDEETPQATIDKSQRALLPLHQAASLLSQSVSPSVRRELLQANFRDLILRLSEGKRSRLATRESIRKKRVVL